MGLYKEGCGHPIEWNMRLVNNGRTYTYCMGCMVERLRLDNLEEYSNPFVDIHYGEPEQTAEPEHVKPETITEKKTVTKKAIKE